MSFRPAKPRAAGTAKAVVAAMYAQAGGAKRVAELIDRSVTQAYAYSDPDEADANISFEQVRKIAQFNPAATAAAEDLAALAGGVFLPSPAPNTTFAAIAAETAEEWGAFTAVLIRAHAGDALERHRTLEPLLREKIDRLLHALATARAALIAIEPK